MEKWDLYDQSRSKIGKIVHRGAQLNSNEFHMVIHVCIINSNNQMLIQQRQPFKSGWPNMWDVTVGGSALTGENSQQAATRETLEEIGYAFDFSPLRPNFTINFDRGFDDYYIIKTDLDIQQLKLQAEEVQQVRWAHKDDIIKAIKNETFIPYHLSVIDMIFDMQNGYGAQSM